MVALTGFTVHTSTGISIHVHMPAVPGNDDLVALQSAVPPGFQSVDVHR